MKTLRLDDIDLAYDDRGSGPTLLLVHGFPLDHAMWSAQLAALAPTHRVLAPDLPGFGRSGLPAPVAASGVLTMEQLADALARFLDALAVPGPVVLCGLSMGGYIAFPFARRYAHRLRGLVLCDTRAIADTAEGAAGRRLMADRVLREGPAPLVESMLPRLFAPATLQGRPDLVAPIRQVMTATDPRTLAAASRGMAVRPDSTPALGDIACPTLVLVGEHDAISPPAEMRQIAAAIPGAQFVEIAGAGHLAPLEGPDAVNAALASFLAQLPA